MEEHLFVLRKIYNMSTRPTFREATIALSDGEYPGQPDSTKFTNADER